MHRFKWICLVLALVLCLCACSAPTAPSAAPASPAASASSPSQPAGSGEESTPSYVPPPFAESRFHGERASAAGEVKLDLSAAAQGYVAVSAASEQRLKFQTIKDDVTYTYDIASDGTPSIFPLQSGNGEYTFRVMENVVDTKYAELMSESCSVTLDDEFQPFLRPSDYTDYSESSECVKKAAELARMAGDALGLVSAVYDFVCSSVTYDREKAATVQSGYLPDPDETMRTGQGICFDYAALAAAMLRSQGIPTKLVFGFVSPNDVYHAWNMFYTEHTGWVTVSFEVRGDTWNRIDLTFAANGADSDFIGDGSNYAELYFY